MNETKQLADEGQTHPTFIFVEDELRAQAPAGFHVLVVTPRKDAPGDVSVIKANVNPFLFYREAKAFVDASPGRYGSAAWGHIIGVLPRGPGGKPWGSVERENALTDPERIAKEVAFKSLSNFSELPGSLNARAELTGLAVLALWGVLHKDARMPEWLPLLLSRKDGHDPRDQVINKLRDLDEGNTLQRPPQWPETRAVLEDACRLLVYKTAWLCDHAAALSALGVAL